MAPSNMPRAEVVVDDTLVSGLLADQMPDLAGLPLRPIAFGWDNVVYRLGPQLCIRLPRRQLAADLVRHEQRWLPVLAPHLPLPVPAPLRAGRPGRGYPWRWSVCPWYPGQVALQQPPRDLIAAADALGSFVAALHRPAPPDAPLNPYRGIPLADRDQITQERIHQIAALVDTDAVRACWAGALAVGPHSGPAVWLHGDLHPGNIVVADGVISAVIDFGDLTSGDPATDLAVAWMLLDPASRKRFRVAAGGIDADTWARGRGWALTLAVALLASSADNPAYHALGMATAAAVIADRMT